MSNVSPELQYPSRVPKAISNDIALGIALILLSSLKVVFVVFLAIKSQGAYVQLPTDQRDIGEFVSRYLYLFLNVIYLVLGVILISIGASRKLTLAAGLLGVLYAGWYALRASAQVKSSGGFIASIAFELSADVAGSLAFPVLLMLWRGSCHRPTEKSLH